MSNTLYLFEYITTALLSMLYVNDTLMWLHS